MISLSYSRISLADIAKKLLLDGAEDAEFIVSKVSRVLRDTNTITFQRIIDKQLWTFISTWR